VDRESEISVFGVTAKAALAGWLCLVLVFSVTLSASHVLHQKVHGTNEGPGHLCLICSFSKGQITSAEVAPILAVFISVLFFSIAPFRSDRLPASDRRLAPGRGPPSSLSSRRVVG